MDVKIDESWKRHIGAEFDKPYFAALAAFVHDEYRRGTCYPPGKLIFNAFNLCPFDKVKVVIIGQDPYHEPGQAQGLCFSVNDGVPFPPSLVNIFKEIQDDLGTPAPQSGSLVRWAEQGVLLLNATLTVRAHQAGSHQGPRRREPSAAWLGGVYRRGDKDPVGRQGQSGVHTLGQLRGRQGSADRPVAPPYTALGPPVAAVGPPRILRQSSLQPCQPISRAVRKGADKVVNDLIHNS